MDDADDHPGTPLPDGVFDVLVLDADRGDDEPAVALELTIVSGEHKGAVVSVSATGVDHDPLDLLGIPATLTVEGGRPAVRLEP